MKRKSLRLSLSPPFLSHLAKSLWCSFCLSFLFSGTVFSSNKYTRLQLSLTHIKHCLPLKLFFFFIPHFFIFHPFTNSALSFEFQTGRISEGGFHNVLSLFRQTAGQWGCNEILKGPFTFCLSLCLPLPPSLSVHSYLSSKSANKHTALNAERKIWKQMTLFHLLSIFSLSVCVCLLSFSLFFLMHSLQLNFSPRQNAIICPSKRTSMWKREAWGERKGRENRMYIAVDGSNLWFFSMFWSVGNRHVKLQPNCQNKRGKCTNRMRIISQIESSEVNTTKDA